MTIVCLDLESFELTVIPTTGSEPPHNADCLTMIASGNNILAFETNCFSSSTRIYIFDVDRSNWISNSIPISNEVSSSGIPRIVFYLPHERKLFAISEENNINEPPLSELTIGKTIASINQQIDFLAALRSSQD